MSFFNADTLISGNDGLLLKDLGDNASTPSSGYGSLYVNSDTLYFINDSGSSTNLLSGGGGASDLGDLSDVSYTSVSGELVITGLDTIKYANSTNAELNVTAVSGLNQDGKNLTISAGQGTGTGSGGSIIFKVADGDTSGSSANPLATAVTINDDKTLKLESDLTLESDSAVISFGNDQEITLTHVADEGLILTGDRNVAGVSAWGGADADGAPGPSMSILTIQQTWDGYGADGDQSPQNGNKYGPGNAIMIQTSSDDNDREYWAIGCSAGGALRFWHTSDNTSPDHTSGAPAFYSGNGGSISESLGNSTMNTSFTGQHRSIMNTNITTSSVGLIVSSTGKYVNIDNTLNSNINESLPICSITTIDNDKKVFGVLSDKEDTNNGREYANGVFISHMLKQNTNEQRIFINSLGEGALWVCNKNGTIENGDYIASSTVPGYGVKQADDLLHNYTVAKLTCDCNFSTTKIVKQKLKVISTTDSNGNTTTAIDYDANGDVQYENDLDGNGNQQMVYEHDTRFLQADGTQITESDYTTRLGNGESVYIACFVGCTYHCG